MIHKILKSRLFSNLYNQFILVGFSHIVPLLLIPFLVNTIGLEKYGLFNFALAFSFFFQVVNELGFDLSNVRHVIANKDDSIRLSNVVSSILICKFIICIITSIIYLLVILSIDTLRKDFMLYLLALIRLIGIILQPYWLFRSLEKNNIITPIALPIKALCILPIFFIVHENSGCSIVMLFFAIESIFSALVALHIMKKKFNISFIAQSYTDIKFYFIDTLPFFYSTLLQRIYQNSNIIVLKFVCGNYIAGLYSTAEKLNNAYFSFISPLLGNVIYPYFVRIKNMLRINITCCIIIALNTLIIIGLYIIAPYIIDTCFKQSSSDITNCFNMFLISIFFNVPINLLGFPYLGIIGKISDVTKATAIASSFYIVSVLILLLFNYINLYSMISVLILTQVITLTILLFYIRKALAHNTYQAAKDEK